MSMSHGPTDVKSETDLSVVPVFENRLYDLRELLVVLEANTHGRCEAGVGLNQWGGAHPLKDDVKSLSPYVTNLWRVESH